MSLVFEHILQYLPSNKNKAIETTIGPIVVPNARFNLLDAECGSPDVKGCADCCNENRVLQ
jgi:hypothetical protein